MTSPSLEPPLQQFDLPRRLVAEALGTALLLAIVIGSGIMGERLAGGNVAVALLGNTLATGAGLAVLITMSVPCPAPISTLPSPSSSPHVVSSMGGRPWRTLPSRLWALSRASGRRT